MRHIVYLGSDGEFVESLNRFQQHYDFDDVEIKLDTFSTGKIVDLCTTLLPYIVFVDFTDPIVDENSLFQEIILLKKHERLMGILFVALWADDADKKKYEQVFTSGFQLAFIKGCEREILFIDSFMIGLGNKMRLPQYAKAKDIDLPLKVGFCSTLTSISAEDFIMETDIDFPDEKLDIGWQLLEGVDCTSFGVQQHRDITYCYSMLMTYLMKYPYPGPWDEIGENSLQKDMIETWMSLNQENLLKEKNWFKVFSPNIELMRIVYDLEVKLGVSFDFTEKNSSIRDELVLKQPRLIFYDAFVDTGANDEIDLDAVTEMISAIKTIDDYKPVLVITNCKTKTAALKKGYGYQNIMTIEKVLSDDILKMLTQSFVEKNKSEETGLQYYFKTTDPKRVLNIYEEIFIKSLTEHEVSFFSPVEIPMYSILHFHLPLDFYGTVIPTDEDMKKHTKGWFYTAIIHGISEESLENLRKFVNQIIFAPIDKITKESVEMILSRKEKETENKKATHEKPGTSISGNNVAEEKSETKKPEPGRIERRRTFKGKSKL